MCCIFVTNCCTREALGLRLHLVGLEASAGLQYVEKVRDVAGPCTAGERPGPVQTGSQTQPAPHHALPADDARRVARHLGDAGGVLVDETASTTTRPPLRRLVPLRHSAQEPNNITHSSKSTQILHSLQYP